MKKTIIYAIGCLILTAMGFMSQNLNNECQLTNLTQLKKLQESKAINKEDEILGLGYNFEGERANSIRSYVKCMKSFGANERITLNIPKNSIGYATYSNENYLKIKNEVKAISDCKRLQKEGLDIYELCSDGNAYAFSVDAVSGKSYFFINIQS